MTVPTVGAGFTVRQHEQVSVPPSGMVTATSLAPAAAPVVTETCAVNLLALLRVTELTVMPGPNVTLLPDAKFEPRTCNKAVPPSATADGATDVTVGLALTVKALFLVTTPPSGFVTVTSRAPVGAPAATDTFMLSVVPLPVTELTTTPVP